MSKPKLVEGLQLEIYVVVTTIDLIGNGDNIADVVLITSDKKKAEKLVKKLCDRTPMKNFDYDKLAEYEDAQYFTRKLNSLDSWGPNPKI
jgi:hypothetical protein